MSLDFTRSCVLGCVLWLTFRLNASAFLALCANACHRPRRRCGCCRRRALGRKQSRFSGNDLSLGSSVLSCRRLLLHTFVGTFTSFLVKKTMGMNLGFPLKQTTRRWFIRVHRGHSLSSGENQQASLAAATRRIPTQQTWGLPKTLKVGGRQ